MESGNPYAPPEARVDRAEEVAGANIDALDVSDTWKKRFRVIRTAGGPGLPNWKHMSRAQRRPTVHFNILAFLFGPIYYLAKAMWRKAITLFLACFTVVFVLAMAMELTGFGRYAGALGYGAAAVFAVRANIDYYKKMVLGDDGWW